MDYADEDYRRLSKDQCRHVNWSDMKDITSREIAHCICENGIDARKIPRSRRKSVLKVLAKLQKIKLEEDERNLIKKELTIPQPIYLDDVPYSKISEGEDTYLLDPSLFRTYNEAFWAMSLLRLYGGIESKRMMDSKHKYKNSHTHDKKGKQMLKVKKSYIQKYIDLGGDEEKINEIMDMIPAPDLMTINQDLLLQRETIKEEFISIGVKSTRANTIAKAITTKLCNSFN